MTVRGFSAAEGGSAGSGCMPGSGATAVGGHVGAAPGGVTVVKVSGGSWDAEVPGSGLVLVLALG
ncbi:hypothetical protein MPS_3563 [Mycobacterium pseudoshottsii JCM 15466]|nr:hypothetical protein MPS_3563 [Mycobacterium pseudoshottsii JCM 15466]